MSNVLVCVGLVFVADPLNVRDCIVPVHYQRSTDMVGPIIKIDLNCSDITSFSHTPTMLTVLTVLAPLALALQIPFQSGSVDFYDPNLSGGSMLNNGELSINQKCIGANVVQRGEG